MILQYDGLDTIRNYDKEYGTDKDHESSDDNIEMEIDPHMEGEGEDVDDETMPIEQEVQGGYADKKARLWVHYKYACVRGDKR